MSEDLKLNQTEELASFIDAVKDYAMIFLGADGTIRTWNSGATRIMGYEPQEIIGSNFSRFSTPPDLAEKSVERELETAARDGRAESEGWRMRKDGTRFWANTVINVLR